MCLRAQMSEGKGRNGSHRMSRVWPVSLLVHGVASLAMAPPAN